MKKLILFSILFLTVVLFLPSKADAQTRQECEKTRDRASYNCLLEFGKCYSPCVAKTKDNMGCRNSCKQVENACDKQVDADYQACLPVVKEDTKPQASGAKQETSQTTDCRKIFDSDMSQCTKDLNQCQAACSEETKKPDGTAYFNSGEIFPKCMKASDCQGKNSACNEQSLSNLRTCGKSDKQPAASEAKKETPKQDENPVIDSIIDLIKESDIVDCRTVPLRGCFRLGIPSQLEGVEWFKPVTGKDLEETLNWQPNITVKDEQKAWREFLPIFTPGKENITIITGEGEIKSPVSPQFIPIMSKGGDTVQVTYLDSTVKSTSDAVQLRNTWSADSGAIINILKWSEIKFQKPAEAEGFTSRRVELGQGEIEVKIRNNKPAENQFGVDAGWLGVTASRTHFWVSQSQNKKMAVVGVYEGGVEVKTKDGQTIKIKPDGDKPGVVVVTQKLSVVKLAFAGLVLAAVAAGVIVILRRKFATKEFSKKKR